MLINPTEFKPQPANTSPNTPLRIGFFTDTYAPQVNGVAVSLQLLVQGLRAAGHDVTIFAPRFPGYQDADPKVYRVPSMRYMHRPPIYLALPGTPRTTLSLYRRQFDVLHALSPLTVGLLAYITASTKDLPLIYTYQCSITDYTHYIKVVGETRLIRYAARWFSTTTTNLGDQIVVPSRKFERLLQAQNVHRPIHVIPNGLDLSNFSKPKSPGSFRAHLGLSAEAPLLLSVGRVDPEKRLDFLIDAFARMAAQYPDAHLVFAGDGSSRLKLEAQATASGYGRRIHFLGMVNRADLPDLLSDATLFLSASTSETQCIAMLEAIAAGLPVVAVQDEAFEGMLVDGMNGRVTSQEADSFSAAVCGLLADRLTLQTFGRNSVELSRKFSIEAQVASLVKLYMEAIQENRRGANMSPDPSSRRAICSSAQ